MCPASRHEPAHHPSGGDCWPALHTPDSPNGGEKSALLPAVNNPHLIHKPVWRHDLKCTVFLQTSIYSIYLLRTQHGKSWFKTDLFIKGWASTSSSFRERKTVLEITLLWWSTGLYLEWPDIRITTLTWIKFRLCSAVLTEKKANCIRQTVWHRIKGVLFLKLTRWVKFEHNSNDLNSLSTFADRSLHFVAYLSDNVVPWLLVMLFVC